MSAPPTRSPQPRHADDHPPPPMSSPASRRTILLLYGNGGGGHKATASAMHTALSSTRHYPVLDVRLVDAAALSGAAAGDGLYNLLLSYNAVSAIEIMHSAIQLFWPLAKPSLLTTFRSYWARHPNLAVVVSFIPMLNAIFADTLPAHVALQTVFTDFSHTDSHPWIQHPRQHLIVGTDVAYAQALAKGYLSPTVPSASQTCTKTTGMVVHPKFYNRVDDETRARRREQIGLHPDLPTVLVLYGGSPPTDRVTNIVDAFLSRPMEHAVNVIAVCARNRQLLQRLQQRKTRHADRHVFFTGFSDEIPLLMQISDVLIGKPGPGVVSEAFVSGLPSVLVTGADECYVMKQERDVLDWVRRTGIGIVAKTSAEAAAVSVAKMQSMQKRIQAVSRNTAVFEVRRLILNAMGLEDDEIIPDRIPVMGSINTDETSSSEDARDIPEVDLSDFTTDRKVSAECSSSVTGSEASREASPGGRDSPFDDLSPTKVRPVPGQSSPTTQNLAESRAACVR